MMVRDDLNKRRPPCDSLALSPMVRPSNPRPVSSEEFEVGRDAVHGPVSEPMPMPKPMLVAVSPQVLNISHPKKQESQKRLGVDAQGHDKRAADHAR